MDGSMDEKEKQGILLQLYQSNEEEKGWKKINVDEPACQWIGISCDPIDDTITSITLPRHNNEALLGIIPADLAKFTNVVNLDLRQAQLSGSIPKEVTASLLNLEVFNIANNDITGSLPPIISDKLAILNVSQNLLSGNIYDTIFTTSSRIKIIDLSRNEFNGTMPSPINAIHAEVRVEEESMTDATTPRDLEILDLSHCAFGSTIPWEDMWHTMTNLRELDLSHNRFVGTIPSTLFETTTEGKSPDSKESELVYSPNNILHLDRLQLQYNLLSGSIPSHLANLKTLKEFLIQGNKFTGSIPQELCDLHLNYQHDSNCSSIYCPPNTYSDSGEGVPPCIQCHTDRINPYLGATAGEDSCLHVEDETAILDELFRSTHGSDWTNSKGWTDHDVSVCIRDGIKCDKQGLVEKIDLKGNNLRGSIPATLGFLKQLRMLNLADNELTGALPSELHFASNLESIDIGGNEMTGHVPPKLCNPEYRKPINGEGTKCDKITCPIGTWHPDGHSFSPDGCQACVDNDGSPIGNFLGTKACDPATVGSSSSGFFGGGSDDNTGLSGGFAIAIVAVVALLIIGTLVKRWGPTGSKSSEDSNEPHDPYDDADAFFDDVEHEYDQSSHWRKSYDSSHHHHIDDDGMSIPTRASEMENLESPDTRPNRMRRKDNDRDDYHENASQAETFTEGAHTSRRASGGNGNVTVVDDDDLLMLDVAQIKINKKF